MGDILTSVGGGIIAILSFIEISPIKINPWKSFAKKIGRAINGEMDTKLDMISEEVCKIKNRVDELQENMEEDKALNCRIRILRFGDEILHEIPHSKEHFDQIFVDIKKYNLFCETHPNFENNVAVMTIKRIENVYMEKLQNNDFL